MSIPYKQIPFLCFLISIFTTSAILLGMEDNLIYKLRLPSSECLPLKRPLDKKNIIKCDAQDNLLDEGNNIKIIKTEKIGDRFDTCFTCAITEHLNITGEAPEKLKINCATDLITECKILEKYYKPIEQPIYDCLVVYTEDNKLITHFGIITKVTPDNFFNCKTKQKWGTIKNIIKTDLFNIPDSYGDNAYFYKLKNKYQKDKLLFLELLQSDISHSQTIKKSLLYAERLLLKLAAGNNISHKDDSQFNSCKEIFYKTLYLLKTCMGLNINAQTYLDKKTPLMLAVERNDTDLVDLFLEMKANINKQDSEGNTALILSTKNNHDEITYKLLCYDADESITNNAGEIPHIKNKLKRQTACWKNILVSIAYEEKIYLINTDISTRTPHEQAFYVLKNCIKTNINAQPDEDKKTPLIIATNNNNFAMVQLFIEHGADITLQDSYGLTALNYALIKNNKEIYHYLKHCSSYT